MSAGPQKSMSPNPDPSDDAERRRIRRSICGWIVLVGVFALASGSLMVPLLLDPTSGRTVRLMTGIPLGMAGVLLLLRLTNEILEYRSRWPPE